MIVSATLKETYQGALSVYYARRSMNVLYYTTLYDAAKPNRLRWQLRVGGQLPGCRVWMVVSGLGATE